MRPGWGFDPPRGMERAALHELRYAQARAVKAINALRVIEEGTHPDPRDLARRVLLDLAQEPPSGQ